MAKLVMAMNQSLDGYVDHDRMTTTPPLFRYWIEAARSTSTSLYGRHIYQLMQFWDGEDWNQDKTRDTSELRQFAEAWRAQHKFVVSNTLTEVGPNATLVREDPVALARRLKAERDGEISVCGTVLAKTLTEAGLIDEYRIALLPLVIGRGKPFFAGPRPPLRLLGSEAIDTDILHLRYAPA